MESTQTAVQPVINQEPIEYVSKPALKALQEASQLAMDEKYTPQHKAQTIAENFAAAREQIAQRFESENEMLDKKIAAASVKAMGSYSPTEDQAAALQYTRAALEVKVSKMSPGEYQQFWVDVLKGNDTITQRVLADFGVTFSAFDKERNKPVKVQNETTEQLQQQTAQKLLTPDQRKAAGELASLQATKAALKREMIKASNQVGAGFQISPDGSLIEQNVATIRSMVKGLF